MRFKFKMNTLKKFDLKTMQKKGSMSLNGPTNKLIVGLVVVVMAAELAPTMFGTNWSAITGAPTFVAVLIPLIIGIGIFFVIKKALF